MDRLYKKLEEYGRLDYYPFHMPGHKRNPLSVAGDFPVQQDITEIEGFDNLHHPVDLIKRAQENAARIYGVKESFYSVNGSTGAILSAVSAAVKEGGHILMGRNCHKAVYHAAYLRNLKTSYIYPYEDMKLGINGGISPKHIEMCLNKNPEIETVLITSPTYDGVVSDIKKIADICHAHGIPLIVDEAHGAHFRFSDYFPTSAAELGADLVIHSLHKTLPCLTQTALLHRCSDRVDRDRLVRFMGIYQSSSPSYILMSSMDACLDKLEHDGQQMFAEFTANLDMARQRLSCCRYIRLADPKPKKETDIFDVDRSKLLLSTGNSSLNGKKLSQILREEFHLEMEMEAEQYALALCSVGDTQEGFERLCSAVEEIDRRESLLYTGSAIEKERFCCQKLDHLMKISQAMDGRCEKKLLDDSVGRVSAEFAYLYPPGIPIVVPGEQITELLVRQMKSYLDQGFDLQGMQDPSCGMICVLTENSGEDL